MNKYIISGILTLIVFMIAITIFINKQSISNEMFFSIAFWGVLLIILFPIVTFLTFENKCDVNREGE